MKSEGPTLEALLRRLAETPRDFLDPPRTGNSGSVHVAALAFDLCRRNSEPCTPEVLAIFDAAPADSANWLSLCAIGCWLLADESLHAHLLTAQVIDLLGTTLRSMSQEYRAERYLLDPERREEFVRMALASLNLRPANETEIQAQDRLQALSSVERRRIIAAARETEKRAREIREALIKKAAAEAADKYTRE